MGFREQFNEFKNSCYSGSMLVDLGTIYSNKLACKFIFNKQRITVKKGKKDVGVNLLYFGYGIGSRVPTKLSLIAYYLDNGEIKRTGSADISSLGELVREISCDNILDKVIAEVQGKVFDKSKALINRVSKYNFGGIVSKVINEDNELMTYDVANIVNDTLGIGADIGVYYDFNIRSTNSKYMRNLRIQAEDKLYMGIDKSSVLDSIDKLTSDYNMKENSKVLCSRLVSQLLCRYDDWDIEINYTDIVKQLADTITSIVTLDIAMSYVELNIIASKMVIGDGVNESIESAMKISKAIKEAPTYAATFNVVLDGKERELLVKVCRCDIENPNVCYSGDVEFCLYKYRAMDSNDYKEIDELNRKEMGMGVGVHLGCNYLLTNLIKKVIYRGKEIYSKV